MPVTFVRSDPLDSRAVRVAYSGPLDAADSSGVYRGAPDMSRAQECGVYTFRFTIRTPLHTGTHGQTRR